MKHGKLGNTFLHGNNGFAKVSKNLARYRFENNCLDHQNSYVGHSN